MEIIIFPITFHIGKNVLEKLTQYENQRIFTVTNLFIVQSNKIEQITKELTEKNELKIFRNVVQDPPIENVISGMNRMEDFYPTFYGQLVMIY